jgi:hypothetical protein
MTSPMTERAPVLDLQRLREVAEAVTYKHWHSETYSRIVGRNSERGIGIRDDAPGQPQDGFAKVWDGTQADFICTFDPATVLALLDLLGSVDESTDDKSS